MSGSVSLNTLNLFGKKSYGNPLINVLSLPRHKRNPFQLQFACQSLPNELGLPNKIQYQICKHLELKHIQKGEFVFQQENIQENYMILLKGKAIKTRGQIMHFLSLKEFQKKLHNMIFRWDMDEVVKKGPQKNWDRSCWSMFDGIQEKWLEKKETEHDLWLVYLLYKFQNVQIEGFVSQKEEYFKLNFQLQSQQAKYGLYVLEPMTFAQMNTLKLPKEIETYFENQKKKYLSYLTIFPIMNQLSKRILSKISYFCEVFEFNKNWVIHKINKSFTRVNFLVEGDLSGQKKCKKFFNICQKQMFGYPLHTVSQYDLVAECQGSFIKIDYDELMSHSQISPEEKTEISETFESIHQTQSLYRNQKRSIHLQKHFKLNKSNKFANAINQSIQPSMTQKDKHALIKSFNEPFPQIQHNFQDFNQKIQMKSQLKNYGLMKNDYLTISREIKQYASILIQEISDIKSSEGQKMSLKYVTHKNEQTFFQMKRQKQPQILKRKKSVSQIQRMKQKVDHLLSDLNHFPKIKFYQK